MRLVGIDTPSVDPEDSKALESHQVLFKNDMAVLEGLCFCKGCPRASIPDRFAASAVGADASPVRAVLVDGWEGL